MTVTARAVLAPAKMRAKRVANTPLPPSGYFRGPQKQACTCLGHNLRHLNSPSVSALDSCRRARRRRRPRSAYRQHLAVWRRGNRHPDPLGREARVRTQAQVEGAGGQPRRTIGRFGAQKWLTHGGYPNPRRQRPRARAPGEGLQLPPGLLPHHGSSRPCYARSDEHMEWASRQTMTPWWLRKRVAIHARRKCLRDGTPVELAIGGPQHHRTTSFSRPPDPNGVMPHGMNPSSSWPTGARFARPVR